MKVFISWSGEKSKEIATAIRNWLPGVIQAVRPYFSPDDVAKGSRWATEIAGELESSKIGLLILTAENIEAPWLLFEAGALGKNIATSKVCPLLFEVDPTDIKGPLVQFQGAKFGKGEMHRVVEMMNKELGDSSLPATVFDNVFDMWWPRLEKEITRILAETHNPSKDDQRSERDLLEEILVLSRAIARDGGVRRSSGVSAAALEDLDAGYSRLHAVAADIDNGGLREAVAALGRPVRYLIKEAIMSRRQPDFERILKGIPEDTPKAD